MLLKKTISKLRAQHLSAARHGNIPFLMVEATGDAPSDSKNQFPLLFHHNSATDNPISWSNSEAELEYADNGIISNISI
jgi:hypothetical protein